MAEPHASSLVRLKMVSDTVPPDRLVMAMRCFGLASTNPSVATKGLGKSMTARSAGLLAHQAALCRVCRCSSGRQSDSRPDARQCRSDRNRRRGKPTGQIAYHDAEGPLTGFCFNWPPYHYAQLKQGRDGKPELWRFAPYANAERLELSACDLDSDRGWSLIDIMSQIA